MKILLFLAGVLYALPVGYTDMSAERIWLSAIIKAANVCREGFGMPAVSGDVDISEFDYENSRNQCMQACLLTRLGLMKDMKMDIEKLEIILKAINSEEIANKRIKAHLDCNEEEIYESFKDECDFANRHYRCVNAKTSRGRR